MNRKKKLQLKCLFTLLLAIRCTLILAFEWKQTRFDVYKSNGLESTAVPQHTRLLTLEHFRRRRTTRWIWERNTRDILFYIGKSNNQTRLLEHRMHSLKLNGIRCAAVSLTIERTKKKLYFSFVAHELNERQLHSKSI